MKIALTGKMRSGKDTVADMFIERGFYPYKLSMGITEVINTYFSDSVTKGNKMRKHYTTIGQSLRELDDLVWIKHTWSVIQKESILRGRENIIITDVRQKNEEEFLRSRGFVIVGVEAANYLRALRAREVDADFDVNELFHETEKSVDLLEVDYWIQNEGTLKELKADVVNLISRLGTV